MSFVESSDFHLYVSRLTFERLQNLLQNMAHALGGEVLVLNDSNLISPDSVVDEKTYFTLVLSKTFSTLIQGKPHHTNGFTVASSLHETIYEVRLTSSREAIATFLHALPPTAIAEPLMRHAVEYLDSQSGPNDPQRQDEFTLRLIATLAAESNVNQTLKTEELSLSQVLEQKVIEKTQELHDTLLAAQTANRVKSEFLAATSHELRTPLTRIIGLSATLLRWSLGELNQRQKDYLQIIHDSGEHLLDMINDILDLSQLEAGKIVLSLSEFSLSRLAQHCLKLFEQDATAKTIRLELDLQIEPSGDRFTADPHRVRQILMNLLSNAVKFTAEGGKVTLRVLMNQDVVTFQVKDTGIGIPEHQRSLLFQKFQQLDQSYQRQYEGTGLGLALTKQLVELHGGWIEVDSTEGVGSVFTVRLPIPRLESGSVVRNTEFPIATTHPAGQIVLIESQEENANLIYPMLTAAGYRVVWMLETSMAVHQIEVLQPMAVIINLQLRDVEGQNLISHLRQNPATKRMKIIALTSNAPEEQGYCLQAGADACLTKPIHPDQVLHHVLALTRDSQQSWTNSSESSQHLV